MVHMSMSSLIPETMSRRLASAHRKIYKRLNLHESVMLLSMVNSQNWKSRKRFQIFRLSRQRDLGKLYSPDHLTFFRLSRNYVLFSWHHCWRRDQSQTSEKHRSFVPSYYGILAGCKCQCTRKNEHEENMLLVEVALTRVQKLAQNCSIINSQIHGHAPGGDGNCQWWLNPSSFCSDI